MIFFKLAERPQLGRMFAILAAIGALWAAGCARPMLVVQGEPLPEGGMAARLEQPGATIIQFMHQQGASPWRSLIVANLGEAPAGDIELYGPNDIPLIRDASLDNQFAAATFTLLPQEKFACTLPAADSGDDGQLVGVMVWDMPTSRTALKRSLLRLRNAAIDEDNGLKFFPQKGEAVADFIFDSPIPVSRVRVSCEVEPDGLNPDVWVCLDGETWSRQTPAGKKKVPPTNDLTAALAGQRRFMLRLAYRSNEDISPQRVRSLRVEREFAATNEPARWTGGANEIILNFKAPADPPPAIELRLMNIE